jgi:hypothetical protein
VEIIHDTSHEDVLPIASSLLPASHCPMARHGTKHDVLVAQFATDDLGLLQNVFDANVSRR